jgi:predicted TIM-barrel fold metal-dependent hydrolase
MDAPANGSGRRYVVISSDSHDSPPYHLERYVEYMDPQHRPEYESWLVADSQRVTKARFGGPALLKQRPQDFVSDATDPYLQFYEELMIGEMHVDEQWMKESFRRYRPTEPPGYLDPVARVEAQESQGIVAEVVNTTGLAAGDASQFGATSHELRRAGAVAHLRWLADYCGAVPGRLAAPIYVDGRDLDEALGDIAWAREHGIFGGVFLPAPRLLGSGMMSASGVADGEGLPAYVDPYWEPLWSACEDLDLPLVVHIGQLVPPDMASAFGTEMRSVWMMSAFDMSYFAKRPFFQLLAAGVLDRHPRLKYCVTEIHVASLPGLFQEADHQTMGFAGFQRQGFEMTPSEYWYRNGFVAASMLSRHEATLVHQVGVHNLMFGSDYPHPEGTWPNTLTVQRHVLGGLHEEELRLVLGENAARCFGFDLPMLRQVADRVGPSVDDLARPIDESELPPYASSFMLHPPPVTEPV